MTDLASFDDLKRALSEAAATGRIGRPLALRVHLCAGHAAAEPLSQLAAAFALGEELFSAPPGSLAARRDDGGRLSGVLLKYPGGETLLATLHRPAAGACHVHLLLIGNHGIARLEGGEEIAAAAAGKQELPQPLRAALEESVQSGGFVDLQR